MVGAYKHQVKMYCYGTLQTQSRDESLELVFCSLDSNLMFGSKVVHTKTHNVHCSLPYNESKQIKTISFELNMLSLYQLIFDGITNRYPTFAKITLLPFIV